MNYMSVVGGVSPTGKSYSFSFVRTCERSCVSPWDVVVSVAGFQKLRMCFRVSYRVVPLPLAAVPLPNSLIRQF